MATEEKSNYEEDENNFIEAAEKLMSNYNINLDDLIDILSDSIDEE